MGGFTSTSYRFQHAGGNASEVRGFLVHPKTRMRKTSDGSTTEVLSITHRSLQHATDGVGTMKSTAARFSWIGVSLCGLMFLGWVLTGEAENRPSKDFRPIGAI